MKLLRVDMTNQKVRVEDVPRAEKIHDAYGNKQALLCIGPAGEL